MLVKLILLLTLMAGGADPAPLSISATPQQSLAPTNITLKIHITPHRDNIQICFGYLDTETLVDRVSCQPLNGQNSLSQIVTTYRNIGPGTYIAFAQLFRAPSYLASTAKANFVVQGDPP